MLNKQQKEYWGKFLQISEMDLPVNVYASIAGNGEIADKLLKLYLEGKKTAGSGLVKDYLREQEPLPQVGDFWIILDAQKIPRCIVKTVKVEIHLFRDVPEEIAIAEGEGDLSLDYWRKAHQNFFEPYLIDLGIDNLEEEEIITEFYEIVFQ